MNIQATLEAATGETVVIVNNNYTFQAIGVLSSFTSDDGTTLWMVQIHQNNLIVFNARFFAHEVEKVMHEDGSEDPLFIKLK